MDYSGDSQGAGGSGGHGSFLIPQHPPQSRLHYHSETVIPVTVKMAMNVHHDEWEGPDIFRLVDGRRLFQVQIVAAIRNYYAMDTHTVLAIEDGTGGVLVVKWFDDRNCPYTQDNKTKFQKENIYVRIVGRIILNDNKIQLLADSISPISSGNEITYHMIAVVHSAEKYKRTLTGATAAIVAPTAVATASVVSSTTMSGNHGSTAAIVAPAAAATASAVSSPTMSRNHGSVQRLVVAADHRSSWYRILPIINTLANNTTVAPVAATASAISSTTRSGNHESTHHRVVSQTMNPTTTENGNHGSSGEYTGGNGTTTASLTKKPTRGGLKKPPSDDASKKQW